MFPFLLWLPGSSKTSVSSVGMVAFLLRFLLLSEILILTLWCALSFLKAVSHLLRKQKCMEHGSSVTPPPPQALSVDYAPLLLQGGSLSCGRRPARSGLSVLTQFLSQAPPFASRPPFPKSRSPGRQEAAGPDRAWGSTVSRLSQQGRSGVCSTKGLSSSHLLPPHPPIEHPSYPQDQSLSSHRQPLLLNW